MDKKDIKILIGMPALSEMKTETATALIMATAKLDYKATLHIHKSCYVHDARNKIVETAKEKGSTHLMFIDSDMAFPYDGIGRLMAHDLDVVGGLYYRRQPPHYPTISQLVTDDKGVQSPVIPNDFPTDKLFQVWGLATGFLLIKMSVFEKLQAPYFYFGKLGEKELGEDYYFCKLVNDAGFKIWCDPTIPLGHVGEYVYDAKDYEIYKEMREKNKEDKFEGNL